MFAATVQPSLDTSSRLLLDQAMLEHMNQFGLDFFGFTWDDSVEVCAAAHVCDAGPQDSDGEQTCSITRESPTQRVPWSPLSRDLMLQRGVTYLCALFRIILNKEFASTSSPLPSLCSLAFNAQHHVASHALPSVQPDEMFTSHAKPYEAEDVPGECVLACSSKQILGLTLTKGGFKRILNPAMNSVRRFLNGFGV
jgi:hypothetical protein